MTYVQKESLWRVLPFASFVTVLALRGAMGDGTLGPIDRRWLYVVQAGLALGLMWRFRSAYRELAMAPRSPTALLLSVTVGTGVFLLWIVPPPSWATTGAYTAGFDPVAPGGGPLWSLVSIRALGAVVVVPVMEELFWRSFLMRRIDRYDFLELAPEHASVFGLLATSAVFALAHRLWLYGLVAGLAYALLYRRLGNLWYAVIAHATTNALLAAWVIWRGAWEYW